MRLPAPLAIRNFWIETGGLSTFVRGRVARRSPLAEPVWDRLRVAASGKRGVIVARDSYWSRLSTRRSLPSSYFSTGPAVLPGEVEHIRISHVTGSHRHPCSAGTFQ